MFRQCLVGKMRVFQQRMEDEAFMMEGTTEEDKLETLGGWPCSQPGGAVLYSVVLLIKDMA